MQQEILQFTAIYSQITTFLVDYSFQIIGAIIVVLAGTYVANKIRNVILTLCRRRAVDVTLAGFIANSVRLLFIAMTTIIALGKLGISVTPFVAAIGALSLGAGLAIQGLVANYGAGFNIILARPFVVGDTISVKGVSGIVEEVHLAYTLLSDEDGVRTAEIVRADDGSVGVRFLRSFIAWHRRAWAGTSTLAAESRTIFQPTSPRCAGVRTERNKARKRLRSRPKQSTARHKLRLRPSRWSWLQPKLLSCKCAPLARKKSKSATRI